MSDEFTKQRDNRDEFLSLGEFFAFVERWRMTILGTALLVVVCATTFTLSRTPVYSASATLRLEEEGKGSGPLADLAVLTSAPAAESEIALLSSRSLAEEVLESTHALGLQEDTNYSKQFGHIDHEFLDRTILVQPESLSPYLSLKNSLIGAGSGPHRLFVALETEDDREVKSLRIEFMGRERVRIAKPRMLGLSDADEVEFDYTVGATIEYDGLRLRLQATGDYADQSYLVRRLRHRDAVERLMARTTVRETSRNSGVLHLTVEDGDPNRAAENANALAQIYFLRSVRLGSSRAERTLGFVDVELERVLKQLRVAEEEFVAISSKHTRAINVTATSKAMIEALASYESEKVRVQLALVSVREARDQIDAGNLRGLSMLGPNLPDPMTISHIQAIGELRATAAGFDRSDAGPYKLLLQQSLADLQGVRDSLALQASLLSQSVQSVLDGDHKSLTLLAGKDSSGDPIALNYLNEIATLDGELARFQELLTQKHPDVNSRTVAREKLIERLVTHAKTRLAVLKGNIVEHDALIASHAKAIGTWTTDELGRIDAAASRLVALVRENLTSQLEGLEMQKGSLKEAINGLEQELASLPEHERQLADPMRRREAFNGIARILLESQQQAQLARAGTMPSAVMIDPAIPPVRRRSPRVFTNIAVSVLLGLLLGLGLAWLRNALLDSLHTQASVEEATDLAVIGSVPDFRYGKLRARCSGKDFLPMRDDAHGAVAESYRSVREALRFSVEAGGRVHTFAATSCVANEGKTQTNVNMAFAFAGGGRRVLLVDADMRSPSLGDYFPECRGEGLADALEGKASWRSSVVQTSVEGLDLLPAGHTVISPNDLLRTDAAVELLEELKASYDHVVFDLPPAMLVSDVETFADKFDSVALVYRSGGVSRGLLIRTVQRLRRSGVKLSGVVLNFVRHSSSDNYGYGYGYGQAYGSEQTDELSRRSG